VGTVVAGFWALDVPQVGGEQPPFDRIARIPDDYRAFKRPESGVFEGGPEAALLKRSRVMSATCIEIKIKTQFI
jgi:hypothetical protein